MREIRGNEKTGRDILNGHKRMCKGRIAVINEQRRNTISAQEAQGRYELERQNSSISMFSEG